MYVYAVHVHLNKVLKIYVKIICTYIPYYGYVIIRSNYRYIRMYVYYVSRIANAHKILICELLLFPFSKILFTRRQVLCHIATMLKVCNTKQIVIYAILHKS